MRNLSSTSFKHACKLSLVLLICASFVLQTNITKPLAETLYAPDSANSLSETREETDVSAAETLPNNPDATSEDLSQSMNSERTLAAETSQSDALGAPFAWDPTTNVLTIQGDCKASDIKNEIASEAGSVQEVCFSGTITITTDQGDSSPFSGATNLERITALDATHVSFAAATGAADPTLNKFFYNCSNLASIDGLAAWDVSNVTGDYALNYMFRACISLTSLDALASWDVSNVAGNYCMFCMFDGCSNLTSLNALASWNITGVSGYYCMQFMFYDCTSLTSLNGLASWNVSNVAGDLCMARMFCDCTDLQDITDIASWNLTKAKASYDGVKSMFDGCPNITYIKGASTAATGFVPESAMDIPTLISSSNFYSEQAPTTPVPGNTLLANWTTYAPQGTWTWKQTVTFDANGGQGAPAPELLVHNSYVTEPTPEQNPTRAGFSFDGWATDAAGTTRFDFAHTKLTADTTLYAQWSPLPVYTVTFDTAGGSLEDTQYIEEGQTATRPAEDPTRVGYTFVDWYTDETGTTLFDFANPISTNTVVYAKWTANTLTASFDLNGEEGMPPAAITLTYGEVFPTDKKPVDPTRTGYSFEGWYTEAIEGSKVEWGTTTVTQTADFVLYAHWTAAPSPSDDIVPEDALLPQTGDATSVLLPLLFISAALGLFAGYAVLKRNEC